MNVYGLMTKTLKLCKLTPTDATARSENSAFFLDAFNHAYAAIMKNKWPVWTTEAVTLDANRCFTLSSLSKKCITVRKVSRYQDFTEDAGYGYAQQYNIFDKDGIETLFVYGAEASGTVYVEYQYMPDRLAVTYNIKGANTLKVIPVDEAITSAEATVLVGKILHVVDVSTGLAYDYTVASAASGAAGAATITVDETISVAVADGDEIYIGDEWEPKFDEAYHDVLCYYATHEYFMARGVNYGGYAMGYWLTKYEREYGRICKDNGGKQTLKNCYRPL